MNKKLDFSSLISQSFDYLSTCQDSFQEKYNLDFYKNWYYEEGMGIFKFYTGEKELFFKYQVVGTFSKKTNTWKWSWDNEHTYTEVKHHLSKVKEFGITHGYEKLMNGLWDADEIDGWEMTSIAANVLKPIIGAYRIPSDHLLTYCVFTEEVPKSKIIQQEEFFVNCGSHGRRRRTFVCSHLNKESKKGFNEAFPSNENNILALKEENDYQAWCDDCEKIRLKYNGWNDTSMEYANIKLVCKGCYFDIKKNNKT